MPKGNWRSLELAKHYSALGLAAPFIARGSSFERGIDIAERRPVEPVTLVRPHAAARAARFFVEKFPGTTMYAVKANPSPELLQILWDAGVTHYDVASIGEVRMARRALPKATLCFMHPVKAEEAIEEAYFVHGVRTFSLDTMDEMMKSWPRIAAWEQRIRAIGHGTRTEMSSGDALEIAAKARPESPVFGDPADPNGRKPGDIVSVMPDDYGKVPVRGEIVSLSAQHIAIRRSDERAGAVVVHFPRAGFLVVPG
jgi:hypothetical protein